MSNDQKNLLKKIMEADFVIQETVLYLDGHPNNKKALDFYKKANDIRSELYAKYTSVYGPVTVRDVNDKNNWSWINSPWPWQSDEEA